MSAEEQVHLNATDQELMNAALEHVEMSVAAAQITEAAQNLTLQAGNHGTSWIFSEGARLVSERAAGTVFSLAEKVLGQTIDYEAVLSHTKAKPFKTLEASVEDSIVYDASIAVANVCEDKGNRLFSQSSEAVGWRATRLAIQGVQAVYPQFDEASMAGLVRDIFLQSPQPADALEVLAINEPTGYDMILLANRQWTPEEHAAGEQKRLEQMTRAPEGWND